MTAPTFAMVKIAAHGRWPEILVGLGIDPAALRNKHGPCPGCGGKDRWRFDDRDIGRFFCNGGGEPVSGDGFALLQHVYGWTAREALERVSEAVDGHSPHLEPITPRRAPQKAPEPSRTAPYALGLWRKARTEDAVVGTHPYAISKGITWAAGAGRGVASSKIVIGMNADCLIVPIRSMDWRVIAVQCINTVGAKQTFGPMQDGCLLLGNTLDLGIPWVVVEGWADAVSVAFHIYKGNAVGICAFGQERMELVARAVADHYHPERITILEDAK